MTHQPNMLLFVSDQQQWQSVCGRSPAHSPNINRFATEGMRFERSYATVALCCPSRACLLSGQFPYHNGIFNQVHVPERTRSDLFPGTQTYPQRLREAGYQLGYVGKWHASWDRNPLDFGFQELRAPTGCSQASLARVPLGPEDDFRAYCRDLGVDNRSANIATECLQSWPGSSPFLFYGIDNNPEAATRPHFETSHGIGMIERYGRQAQPWFVTINVVEPHDPYVPLAQYAAHYDPADVALPPSWQDDFANKPYMNRRDAEMWAGLSEHQVRTAIARYWAHCEQVDAQVGRLMAALERSGQADNTLVLFTSDHGDMLGAHRQFIKGWQPYEETYRVPLVARWPGVIAAGSACEHLVQLHDLAHTFADVAGATPITPADGRSLLPLFQEPERRDWSDDILCMYYGGEFLYTQRMLITPRYKYVFNAFDIDEVYDLERDPNELHNIVADPAASSVVADLRDRLYALMERHGDPYISDRYGAPRYLARSAPTC